MRLIDADALIDEIKTCLWDWEFLDGLNAKTVLKQTITDIGNMPTVDAVPVKHGKWEVINGIVSCTVCGEHCMEFNYCPNCGAKMDGERKDDER